MTLFIRKIERICWGDGWGVNKVLIRGQRESNNTMINGGIRFFNLQFTILIICIIINAFLSFSVLGSEKFKNLNSDQVKDVDRADYNSYIINQFLVNQERKRKYPRSLIRRRLRHFDCGPKGGLYCPNFVFKCQKSDDKETFNGGKGCLLCPAGYYSPADSVDEEKNPIKKGSVDECRECERGKYSDKSGQSSCKLCPVSTYQDRTGSPSCQACKQGFFNFKTGAEKCNSCKNGGIDPNTVLHFKQSINNKPWTS